MPRLEVDAVPVGVSEALKAMNAAVEVVMEVVDGLHQCLMCTVWANVVASCCLVDLVVCVGVGAIW